MIVGVMQVTLGGYSFEVGLQAFDAFRSVDDEDSATRHAYLGDGRFLAGCGLLAARLGFDRDEATVGAQQVI
jgi:hypothetical protein